jgi:hypothetical protein
LVIGLLFGGALAAATGARRSSSAIDRFIEYSRPEDGFVEAQDPQFDIDAVQDLPNVEAAVKGGFLFLAPLDDQGQPQLDQLAAIAPLVFIFTKGQPGSMNRFKMIAGRMPDPSTTDEVLVDEEVASKRHLHIGSQLRMQAFSPEQAEQGTSGDAGEQPPAGPQLTFTVVGIGRTPSDLDPSSVDPNVIYQGSAEMYLTEGFWERYGDEVATAGPIDALRAFRLTHGAADAEAFTAAVRALPHGDSAFIQFGTSDSVQAAARARDAVALETGSLTALAAVLGLAGVVLCGLALARLATAGTERSRILRALGVRPTGLFLVALVPPIAAVALGWLLAVVAAVAISPLFPIGLARKAEIDPGVHVDALVLGAGGAAVVAALVVVSLVVAWRASVRLSEAVPATRRPSIASRLATVGAPFGVVVGAQFASGTDPRSRTRGRTTIGVASVGVIALVGVLGFVASLDRLADRPAAYGWTWDYRVGNPNNDSFTPTEQAAVRTDRFVGGWSAVADPSDVASVDGRPVPIAGFEFGEGDVGPPLLEGRAATADGEVVLGHDTLAAIGRHVGDTVSVSVQDTTTEMRVVGSAMLNGAIGDNQTPGDGVLVAMSQLHTFVPEASGEPNGYLVRLAPGVDPAAAYADLRAAFGPTVLGPHPPTQVANVLKVRSLPVALAVAVGCASAILLLYALVTTVRGRRRDLAVLKALGANRRQVASAIGWQALLMVGSALVIGMPLGVGVGRQAWRWTEDGFGTLLGPQVPLLTITLLGAGALVAAVAVAVVPAFAAAATPAAAALRQE